MLEHQDLYNTQADQYELLISREDYQQNVLSALNQIRPLVGLDVVELGAGTGRLTCLLAPIAKSIRAFDASQAMLEVAMAKLRRMLSRNWTIGIADHRNLPVTAQSADLVISGWSICYTVVYHPENWREELGKALAEMKRVLRPGGTIILLETQGTGHETPHPPEKLVKYYRYLEANEGFSSTWIRTDYLFDSLEEAESLVRFFFGDTLADQTVQEKWAILPECTGIWWLTP
jgi:ubiquinone/menaquinone biosynthesis C-methylase UbiE